MSATSGAPNRNVLWARALVDAWARLGATHACVGSGSRSSPLVEAVAADERFAVHPHVDERSAAFFALGLGVATRTPTVLVTTSGTAAANLFPAVVEASQSEIPVLVVTADRPARLRGTDANQTIDQVDLFGRYPRLSIDLNPPEPTEDGLARLRRVAFEAWTTCLGPAPGPVHINVQLEKPLEPTFVEGDVPPELEARLPAEARDGPESDPDPTAEPRSDGGAQLAARLEGAERPLLVCGPTHDRIVGRAALELAAAVGCPVLADPLSGARFGPTAAAWTMGAADVSLGADEVVDALAPDVIIRVGRSPTSVAVCRYLERHAATRQIVIDAGRLWQDHLDVAPEYLASDPTTTLRGAAEIHASGSSEAAGEWSRRWRLVDTATRAVIETATTDSWFEGAIAATVAGRLPENATWFIGNSMPIRDVDAFAGAMDKPIRAMGFRGASGIDGNVSGAIGAAIARGEPAVALLGDLTVLHDVGALLAQRSIDTPLVIVVIQNRGGGIFHMLPIREHDPPFTPYVVMPQSVEFEAVAAAAGIPHRPVATVAELEDGLAAGLARPGIQVCEAQVDHRDNWTQRRAAIGAAQTAAAQALNQN